MEKQFTASEVHELAATIWPDLSGCEEVAEVLNAFADMLEAQEKAVPAMVVNHVSSAEHDLPIGMKLYTHPAPSDAEKRDTMTPRELAKRIERGEKWKLADEPMPTRFGDETPATHYLPPTQDAERLAEALHSLLSASAYLKVNADNRSLFESGQDTDRFRSAVAEGYRALDAYSAQAQPPAASVPTMRYFIGGPKACAYVNNPEHIEA